MDMLVYRFMKYGVDPDLVAEFTRKPGALKLLDTRELMLAEVDPAYLSEVGCCEPQDAPGAQHTKSLSGEIHGLKPVNRLEDLLGINRIERIVGERQRLGDIQSDICQGITWKV